MVSESKKITQMFLLCMRHSMRKQTPLIRQRAHELSLRDAGKLRRIITSVLKSEPDNENTSHSENVFHQV